MNKSQLIEKISRNANISKKEASKVVDVLIDSITSSLKSGEPVSLVGFGTFQVNQRAARTGRNPQTGAIIEIAAAKIPTFKAGKALKNQVGDGGHE